MTRGLELGLGALEVLSVPGAGRVVGVYSKAAYLRLPAGLVALTTFDVPSGPVHARSPAALDRLEVDDRAVVAGSLLQAGRVLLDLRDATVWRGPVPTAAGLQDGRHLALDLLERANGSALDSELVGTVGRLLKRRDIAGAAAHLGGVGPGLTPAGDDCLAGILLVAGILAGEPAEGMLEEVALKVATNDVSRSFLHWAARGQSIEPVHRFLMLAAEGGFESAEVALKELTNFGHSSGADIALGLKLGLDLL